MIRRDIRAAFLQELTALTHKYGIRIEGCGCCESPYLVELDEARAEWAYSAYANDGQLGMRSLESIEQQEWWLKDE